ncbi:hypothetical protein NC651_002533 [Populus alba x Populus x berolinensis]|nr:hypothetical protein NC651_002533 [Populus alba x Populus x berolinensis]
MCRSLILCFWTLLGSLLLVSNPFLCRNCFFTLQFYSSLLPAAFTTFLQGLFKEFFSLLSFLFPFFVLFSSQLLRVQIVAVPGQMLMRFLRRRIIDRPAFWQRPLLHVAILKDPKPIKKKNLVCKSCS